MRSVPQGRSSQAHGEFLQRPLVAVTVAQQAGEWLGGGFRPQLGQRVPDVNRRKEVASSLLSRRHASVAMRINSGTCSAVSPIRS